MKHLIVFMLCACIVIACQQPQVGTNEESMSLPFEVSYKGRPEIGSLKNVQTVMEWNKRISQKNFNVGDLVADSVTIHLADGMEATMSRDSTIAMLNSYIGAMETININYIAAIPLDNPEQKHEWVLSWTEETYTYADGKVDHTFFHEDYRLEDGKIREVFQYGRKGPQTKPAGVAGALD